MGGFPGHASDSRQHRSPPETRPKGDDGSAPPRCGRTLPTLIECDYTIDVFYIVERGNRVPRLFSSVLMIPVAFGLLYSVPAYGHGCGHHRGCGYYGHDHGCYGCGSWSGATRWANPPARSLQGTPANVQSLEGKVAEVVYLPGVTPDTAMVELKVLAGSDPVLVRLGPAGFLKQGQLNLKEGDTINVSGYRVSAGDGELLVASEISKQGKTLRLRDRWGRPAW